MLAAVETSHLNFPNEYFFKDFKEKTTKEKAVNLVKAVDITSQIENIKDIELFSQWFQDIKSAKHFVPKLDTLGKCLQYYQNPEMPQTLFLTARNAAENKPLAVITVKPRDEYFDQYVALLKKNELASAEEIQFLEETKTKTAYLEKMIVKSDLQGQGIGKTLLATTLDFIFQTEKYKQCDLWIMTGQLSGEWDKNLDFFTKTFGFRVMYTKYSLWTVYSEEILSKDVKSQALWLYTTPELWFKVKSRDYYNSKKPRLNPAPLIDLRNY